MQVQDLEQELKSLLAKVENYNNNPTKAESKRIRSALNELRKATPGLRSELMTLDKQGY